MIKWVYTQIAACLIVSPKGARHCRRAVKPGGIRTTPGAGFSSGERNDSIICKFECQSDG